MEGKWEVKRELRPRVFCKLPRVRHTFHRAMIASPSHSLFWKELPRRLHKTCESAISEKTRFHDASKLPYLPQNLAPNRHAEGLRGDLPATSLWASRSLSHHHVSGHHTDAAYTNAGNIVRLYKGARHPATPTWGGIACSFASHISGPCSKPSKT